MSDEKTGEIVQESTYIQDNLLDIDKVLADRSPMLKKLMPGFVTSYLKRLLHQDWLNHFLTDTFGSPTLAEQVNHNPLLVSRVNECEAFHGTTANFVTVDFVDIGDTFSTIEALNASEEF